MTTTSRDGKPPIAFVDAHMHQWDPRSTPRESSAVVRVLGRTPRLMRAVAQTFAPATTRQAVGRFDHVLAAYLPVDYSADARRCEVVGVVHVEAGWHSRAESAAADETTWVCGLHLDGVIGPPLLAIVARADLCHARAADSLRAQVGASPLVRGVRQVGAHHTDPGIRNWAPSPNLYRSAAFLRGYEQLAAAGLRFDALVYSQQLGDVAALAARFPEVPLALCHLGTPAGVLGPVGRRTGHSDRQRAGILAAWRDDLAALAALPHVHAKVSGLLEPIIGHPEIRRRIRLSTDQIIDRVGPLISHALDVFTPDRLMFASNFPMDKVAADLPDIVDAYASVVAQRGDDAVQAVFRKTATSFYRI